MDIVATLESKSIAQLKKIADAEFSKMVRLRDADKNGVGSCITCESRVHWSKAQNGHFVSRKVSLLRYDEQNCNLQCIGCNMFKSGEQYAYSKALDGKYGSGTADKLWEQRHTTHKFTKDELLSIIYASREETKYYLNNLDNTSIVV